MEKIESKKLIVLTGAGFTKNFGGFLGKEMWSKLFNDINIQRIEKIKKLLQNEYDFESVYSKVLSEDIFSKMEKSIMQQVIGNIYKQLDDSIRNWTFNDKNPLALNKYGLWGDLFSLFNSENRENGLFFTLNQDLLLERKRDWHSLGVPRFSQDFYSLKGEFKEDWFVTLPADNIEQKIKDGLNNHNGIHYIKLHGSYGWKSSDGLNQMVIGTKKEKIIEKEPLLKYYFDLFKNAVREGNKRMLIIGYGFKDKHINKIIWDGAKNHNLKIYIITTTSPEDFYKLKFTYDGYNIRKAINGYFPYTLREIFPPNQNRTTYIDEIRNSLLY